MRILHINKTASSGGAGIATRRHCEAMRRVGIDSEMLSMRGKNDSFTTIYPTEEFSLWEHLKESIPQRLMKPFIKQIAWNWEFRGVDVSQLEIVQQADLIYIHWVDGFLNYKTIEKILELGKPVVWFLHDMYPITGGCHHSFGCVGYENDCKKCPELRMIKFMASQELKRHVTSLNKYQNLIGVAPSKWLTSCLQKSALFRGHKIFCVPNVIDTNVYVPLDKQTVRIELKLPVSKKIILFSATEAKNRYKGPEYLIAAITTLAENHSYEFCVVGLCDINMFPRQIQNRIHILGYVSDTATMVKVYNSADVLLITSMADNFPNVVIEAMSCGVPVAGFATGGIKDQIVQKYNGFIVEPKDVDGIVEGVNWILNNRDYATLQNNCRKHIIENYSYSVVDKVHKPIFDLLKI